MLERQLEIIEEQNLLTQHQICIKTLVNLKKSGESSHLSILYQEKIDELTNKIFRNKTASSIDEGASEADMCPGMDFTDVLRVFF